MRKEALIFLHLRLVGRISLGVGAVAVASLLISLLLISGQPDDSYFAIIRSSSITREHLGQAMLLIGLQLVAMAGVITWLIVLYSSFRIAGPLYRFSKNLRLASSSDSAALLDLRAGDPLHRQADNIKQAVYVLRAHCGKVEQAAHDAAAALDADDAAAYVRAVERLKALDAQVRV